MPRKPRIEFEGAFYHVITRGNQRQKIFKDPADYQKYLQTLAVYRNRYPFHLYAYVLMGNHVHLLIEMRDAPLSKILQGVNQSHTLYFNKRYRTIGHLFQGRYKAILCDRENYLLALLKYLHYNPVRARITETPDDYPWSSHPAYTGKANPLGLVDTDPVLKLFSENKTGARRRYREFIAEAGGLNKDEVYATIDQRIQGEEDFAAEILEKYDGTPKKRWKKEYTLAQIAHAIEDLYGVSPAELVSPTRVRRVTFGRVLFSLTAKGYGYKGTEVSEYLGKDPASVAEYERKRGDTGAELQKVARYLERGDKTR